MSNQLLVTFYVESPNNLFQDVAVSTVLQYQSGTNWYQDGGSDFSVTVTNAHYEDENGLRRRYKIDVFRTETSTSYNNQSVYYYRLHKAGTYKRRIQVLFDGNVVLERMIYITIQPNIQVYWEGDRSQELGDRRIDLVYTEETVVSVNPLVKQMTVVTNNTTEALAARTLALTKTNAYKETVFVKSNLPVDLVSNDLTEESVDDYYSNSQWLQLQDTITVTRKIKNTNYQWGGYY